MTELLAAKSQKDQGWHPAFTPQGMALNNRAVRSLFAITLVALSLAGCNEAGITCPTLRTYSPAFMAAAAKELDEINTTAPHLAKLVDDYSVERDAIRRCIKLRGTH